MIELISKNAGAGATAESAWESVPLGELVRLQRGHDLTELDRRDGSVPVVGSAGVNGYHDTALAAGPGLVIGRSGASFGRVHFVDSDYWPHNTALYVTDFLGNDPRFVYYLLSSIDFSGFNSGSAQPSLNRNFIYQIPLRKPPLPEQRQISHVLGTLDDKIELNRRMNRTLEEIARAIFRSWFVDFDPVRAKAEGRQPAGMDAETAALFPDAFVDSELGPIPAGWRTGVLSDIMTFEGGAQPTASTFIDTPRRGYVRLVQIRDFKSDSRITFVPDSPKLRKFGPDDVMIARYGSSGNAGETEDSLGRVCRGLEGAYNVALVKVIPLANNREFLYRYLQSGVFQTVVGGMGARSVQSGFRKEDLSVIRIVVPPPQVFQTFEQLAAPWWDMSKALSSESSSLALIRDTLLPKLLSGELRAPVAEEIVAGATA